MSARTRGFSLVEVLVALLVISIGLLGIAKMQALALSNTNGGRLRALAALQAESLASTIQAERNYWGNVSADLTIGITTSGGSSTINSTDNSANVNATITCAASSTTTIGGCSGGLDCTKTSTPCNAQTMAAYDLQQWAGRVQQLLGQDVVQIFCNKLTPTVPVTCRITINWTEAQVNSTTSESAFTSATAVGLPSYQLFVNP
jgi:type IV pilus assembly protein PilV